VSDNPKAQQNRKFVMVQKTVVSETCDSCAVAGRENVKGEEFEVGGVVIGACAKCRKALAPVVDLLATYGRPEGTVSGRIKPPVASQAARSGRRVKCGECTQEVAFGSRSYHAQHHHGVKMSEVKWR
jgi:hypothetical protein